MTKTIARVFLAFLVMFALGASTIRVYKLALELLPVGAPGSVGECLAINISFDPKSEDRVKVVIISNNSIKRETEIRLAGSPFEINMAIGYDEFVSLDYKKINCE